MKTRVSAAYNRTEPCQADTPVMLNTLQEPAQLSARRPCGAP